MKSLLFGAKSLLLWSDLTFSMEQSTFGGSDLTGSDLTWERSARRSVLGALEIMINKKRGVKAPSNVVKIREVSDRAIMTNACMTMYTK